MNNNSNDDSNKVALRLKAKTGETVSDLTRFDVKLKMWSKRIINQRIRIYLLC